ncbi:MAG: type II secretion system F family protein [Pseudomonadota bacterium]|nr:type II secretion system F family protein [Pseudomonadota bacterium]
MADFDLNNIQLAWARLTLKTSKKLRWRAYRKLGGMLKANEPLGPALERLWLNASRAGKKPSDPLALLIREWLKRYRAGASFSEALEGSLPDRDLMMIRAGEESGSLAAALEGIQTIDTAAAAMKEAISRAVAYPLFLGLLLFGILWMFGVTMIEPMRQSAPPQVMAQMAGLGAVSDFIRSWGLLVIGVLVAFIVFIVIALPHWRGKVRVWFDRIPPWSWYRVWQGATFMLGMSALLKAQVPLRRAMETMESQARGAWLRERIGLARLETLKGKNLGEALRATGLNFPSPEFALDLEILSERGDVGQIIDIVTKEWLEDQTEALNTQATIIRFMGMIAVAVVIAWAMLSIVGITAAVQKGM